jgi:hypothetical protein
VRSSEEFDAAKRLMASGLNNCAIARQIGVPRTTVRDWRLRPAIRSRDIGAPCRIDHDFSQLPAAAYCYVLGLYLGDGCISRSGRVWHFRVTLDRKYPAIIDRCRQAIDLLMPGQRGVSTASRVRRRFAFLQALALPVATAWPGQEAHASDRA